MPAPLPSLNGLRAFEAAARHMSFTRAAAELSVTQTAISHQIRRLEEQLGTTLFVRRNRALSLTREARDYLPAVRAAFDDLRQATARLRRPERDGVLTVSTTASLATKWLVPRMAGFQDTHPDIEVRLTTSSHLVDFRREQIDMAVRYGSGRYPALEVQRLMSETVIPVASPTLLAENPLDGPQDLAHHTLLHDGSPSADESCPDWAMWLAARGVRGIDGTRGPRFNQSSLVIEAAVGGRGVALAKRTLAQADLEAGRLVAPLQIATEVDFAYYLVHPKAKGRLPQVKAFAGWVGAEAEAHEAALRAIDNGAGI